MKHLNNPTISKSAVLNQLELEAEERNVCHCVYVFMYF